MTSHAPEVFVTCEECCGEGAIDPPCAHVIPCQACDGVGGFIQDAE